MNKYIGPIKWLGGIAVVLFAFALAFEPLTRGLSEETRKSVILNAIPFFSTFVGILLLFILLIVLIAMRFNGAVPERTYRSIEYTIIAGILLGVICLFQPWSFVPYRYGFLLLLGSTLSFILWSHVAAPRADFVTMIAPLSPLQHIIGAVVGVVVAVLLFSSLFNMNSPKPPYGLRERVFNSYDDERKAQVAAEATQQFQTVETPFLVFFSAFPGVIIYFAAREAAGRRTATQPASVQTVVASGSS